MALSLNLFWHMHQPDYRGQDGVMRMPWVFLHAIKDYYDMPWMLSLYPSLKATFNITPPLIEQLLMYEKYGITKDKFLTLWAKPCEDLDTREKESIIKICKSAQFDTMVSPLPRFVQLYKKDEISNAEMVDLEVLFLLSWCGNYLRRNSKEIKAMIAKGSGFGIEDKALIIKTLLSFIPKILPFYKSLLEKKQISLATTPLNHPILPLLLDMKNAKISNPKTVLPKNAFSLVEDAKMQVSRAIELFKDVFGKSPSGFWPAEGAVDEKSISLYKKHNIRWIATDEAILFASTKKSVRNLLYAPYSFNDVAMVFRDHGLSDLIGFTYRFWDSKKAADDFLSHLKDIHKNVGDGIVSVILDGENAWEYYPNNGFDFFDAFYKKLTNFDICTTVTMDEISKMKPKKLADLHPGSWINGTFDTWVGHPQKNAAWELIFQTKTDYHHHLDILDKETKERINSHFLASECSDWFWWYGDDHYTEFGVEFDQLFRSHLIEIYRLMKVAVPSNLYLPIVKEKHIQALISQPKFPIHVLVDGKKSSFFEWLGSGVMDETKHFSTMDKVRGPIEKIYWGEDKTNIYLRLDGDMNALKKEGGKLHLYIEEKDFDFTFDCSQPKSKKDGVVMAIGDIIEIGIKKKKFRPYSLLHIRMEVEEENLIVQTLPGAAELEIRMDDDYAANWFV